ncbi:MAG TPA: hypothetical protein VK929_04790 [Longimicrobiales bacterium]|nr:hypothetical protein [Longimicrobiales bacterium]
MHVPHRQRRFTTRRVALTGAAGWPLAVAMAAALAVASCVELTGPTPPPESQVMEVPAEYEHWWQLTEQCSGLSGDFHDVRWLVLEDTHSIPQHNAQAAWYSRGNQILVVDGYQQNGRLIRHEMLHALLGRSVSGHPREYFVQACAGVVSCAGQCEAEAGTRDRYEDAPMVLPETLHLSARVAPDTLERYAIGRVCVTVTVSARNPHDHPVRVALPERPSGYSPTFGWRIGQSHGGLVGKPRNALAFGAGETRRHVFDCVHLGPVVHLVPGLDPGDHLLYGSLLSAESEPARLTVSP